MISFTRAMSHFSLGFAHRLHLVICNSLGLWLRSEKNNGTPSLNPTRTIQANANALGNDDSIGSLSLDSDSYIHSWTLNDEFDPSMVNMENDNAQNETVDDDSTDEDDYTEANSENNWTVDIEKELDSCSCEKEKQMIGSVLEKCRSLVKLIKESSILIAYINVLKKEFNICRSLQLDCKSRWNSTYRLIETLMIYKRIISKLMSDKHELNLNDKQKRLLTSIEFDKTDWIIIESLENLLRPFSEAIKLVSGSNYSTIGVGLFTIVHIRDFLEDTRSSGLNHSKFMLRLKQFLLTNMEKYFNKDSQQFVLIKVIQFWLSNL